MPARSAWRLQAERVHLSRDPPQTPTFGAAILNDGQQGRGDSYRVPRGSGSLDGTLPAWIPQLRSSLLRSSERGLGALRNGLALVLGDGGKDMNGQAVCLGHIDGDEIDAALHQPGDEMDVAGEPIKPGDNECGFLSSACIERGGELGPVGVPLAALDLLELGEQGSAMGEAGDGGPLGFQSKAALALAFGRNPVVGHKRAHLGDCTLLKRTFQRVQSHHPQNCLYEHLGRA